MDIKPKHEEKNCPRCGGAFECRQGDIARCQCNGITLSKETGELIARRYEDCLCRKCLLELAQKPAFFREKFGASPH